MYLPDIKRNINIKIDDYLSNKEHKIFFIWGPRRSGKTTTLRNLSQKLGIKLFNFDFIEDRELFVPQRIFLDKLVKEYPVILIDEVQNYPQITQTLKILYDNYNVKIIATGSSELRQTTNDFDTLSGRFIENYCLPLSIKEIINYKTTSSLYQNQIIKSQLDNVLIYGNYPEVYLSDLLENQKQNLLNNIINTYVLKDIIDIYNLKNLRLARDILTKLALQIGSEVSLREIANSLDANITTISNYVQIFLKNYILIELPSFKSNMRRAVLENKKYYFYDLGLRNAFIRDFRDQNLRPDSGAVFENFIISEVEKIKRYGDYNFSTYFYREYNGKEVDLVIETFKKQYKVFDIKTHKNLNKVNNIFPLEHKLNIINQENYYDILENIWKE